MSTGYEQITAALGNLKSAVQVVIHKDLQDLAQLGIKAAANPLYHPMYTAALAQKFVKITRLNSALAQAVEACKGDLLRASDVVTVKENEAVERLNAAEEFRTHADTAKVLATSNTEWMGDASGLYRDTAEVCRRGLQEIAGKLQNSAAYCEQIAHAHRVTYTQLALVINIQATFIRMFGAVPFGLFFQRMWNAERGLAHIVTEAGRALSGDLVREGLLSGGASARQVMNDMDVLESSAFRADPEKV